MADKISIITVVYNNVSEIKDTIESALNQTYPYIEYTLERKFVSNSGDSACVKDYWADGVGSLIDPFVRDISRPRIGPGSYVFVHGCKVKGREVYLAMTMGLKNPQINTDKAAIYDLSGRRLQAIPQRGVYIVNGKKYIR